MKSSLVGLITGLSLLGSSVKAENIILEKTPVVTPVATTTPKVEPIPATTLEPVVEKNQHYSIGYNSFSRQSLNKTEGNSILLGFTNKFSPELQLELKGGLNWGNINSNKYEFGRAGLGINLQLKPVNLNILTNYNHIDTVVLQTTGEKVSSANLAINGQLSLGNDLNLLVTYAGRLYGLTGTNNRHEAGLGLGKQLENVLPYAKACYIDDAAFGNKLPYGSLGIVGLLKEHELSAQIDLGRRIALSLSGKFQLPNNINLILQGIVAEEKDMKKVSTTELAVYINLAN
jgi:hypothetical protein